MDVVRKNESSLLVTELLDSDLESLIQDENVLLTPASVKSIMLMMLRAVAHLHSKHILHRVSVVLTFHGSVIH